MGGIKLTTVRNSKTNGTNRMRQLKVRHQGRSKNGVTVTPTRQIMVRTGMQEGSSNTQLAISNINNNSRTASLGSSKVEVVSSRTGLQQRSRDKEANSRIGMLAVNSRCKAKTGVHLDSRCSKTCSKTCSKICSRTCSKICSNRCRCSVRSRCNSNLVL